MMRGKPKAGPRELWRERLREAVRKYAKRERIKQAWIAYKAGVSPETLSRVLNGLHPRPSFATILRIAHAVEESIGHISELVKPASLISTNKSAA
jgi:transcriptional regulator with XRE-family HTH domain